DRFRRSRARKIPRATASVGKNLPRAGVVCERQTLPSAPPKRIARRRFVRFAPEDAGRNAFLGGSPQKNFGLVNPFLRVLSQPRNWADAMLVRARARAESKR